MEERLSFEGLATLAVLHSELGVGRRLEKDDIIRECYSDGEVRVHTARNLKYAAVIDAEVLQSQKEVSDEIAKIVWDVRGGEREGGGMSVLGAMGLGKSTIAHLTTMQLGGEAQIFIDEIELNRWNLEIGDDGKTEFMTQLHPGGHDTGLRAYVYSKFQDILDKVDPDGPDLVVIDEVAFATDKKVLSKLASWGKKHNKVILMLGLNYNYRAELFDNTLPVIESSDLARYLVASQCRVVDGCLNDGWSTRREEYDVEGGFWHPALESGEEKVAGSVYESEERDPRYKNCCGEHYQLYGPNQQALIEQGAKVVLNEKTGLYHCGRPEYPGGMMAEGAPSTEAAIIYNGEKITSNAFPGLHAVLVSEDQKEAYLSGKTMDAIIEAIPPRHWRNSIYKAESERMMRQNRENRVIGTGFGFEIVVPRWMRPAMFPIRKKLIEPRKVLTTEGLESRLPYIVVVGSMRIGKTTLVELLLPLMERFNSLNGRPSFVKVEEFKNNPFLKGAYHELKSSHIKNSQDWFLDQMLQIEMLGRQFITKFGSGVVQDQMSEVYLGYPFTYGIQEKMNQQDFWKYIERFSRLPIDIQSGPDLVIYLTAKDNALVSRAMAQARKMEKVLEAEFHLTLNAVTNAIVERLPYNKLIIDTTDLDFSETGKEQEKVISEVARRLVRLGWEQFRQFM